MNTLNMNKPTKVVFQAEESTLADWKAQAEGMGLSLAAWARAKCAAMTPIAQRADIEAMRNGDEDAPEALLSARWVSHMPPTPGDSELVKMYQVMKKDEPKHFLAELRNLEKAYLQAKGKDENAGIDAGTDECIALVEKLLLEYQ
jgi:hypothetical protein